MRLVIFSNLFIALAAVALAGQTYALLGARPASAALLILVFCATLFVYNLDRLVSQSREDNVATTERHLWIRQREPTLWVLAGLAAAGAAASLVDVPTAVLWGLIPLGAVALAYSLPVIPGAGGRARRLKDLPGLKIFLIALVWAAVTVVLPALDAGVGLDNPDTILAFAERVIFVFAITLPFDVRDLERDSQAAIDTLPMMIGANATRWLACALMAVFCALVGWHYGLALDSPAVALVANGVLTTAVLWFSDVPHPEMYYVGLLDATMVAQGAMVIGYVQLVGHG